MESRQLAALRSQIVKTTNLLDLYPEHPDTYIRAHTDWLREPSSVDPAAASVQILSTVNQETLFATRQFHQGPAIASQLIVAYSRHSSTGSPRSWVLNPWYCSPSAVYMTSCLWSGRSIYSWSRRLPSMSGALASVVWFPDGDPMRGA